MIVVKYLYDMSNLWLIKKSDTYKRIANTANKTIQFLWTSSTNVFYCIEQYWTRVHILCSYPNAVFLNLAAQGHGLPFLNDVSGAIDKL